MKSIDEIVKDRGEQFYVEMLAKPGVKVAPRLNCPINLGSAVVKLQFGVSNRASPWQLVRRLAALILHCA